MKVTAETRKMYIGVIKPNRSILLHHRGSFLTMKIFEHNFSTYLDIIRNQESQNQVPGCMCVTISLFMITRKEFEQESRNLGGLY